MRYRRVRIFVPAQEPYRVADWAETFLAHVGPTCSTATVAWWWFTRYAMPSTHADASGDCVLGDVGPEYVWNDPDTPRHRSVRLTLGVDEQHREAVEAAITTCVAQHGGFVTSLGFIDYGLDADLGGTRFFPAAGAADARHRRAERVAALLHAASELLLDGLESDGAGHFAAQRVPDVQNCNAHLFDSPHHLFCNISGVPLDTFVVKDARVLTYFMGLVLHGVDLRQVPVPRSRVVF
jgi:hypothetical protein